MNYEEIFNLAYSNYISESIQDSILDTISENYEIVEEAYEYEPFLNFIDYLTSTSISESSLDSILDFTFGSLSEEVINEVSDEYIRRKAKAAIKQRTIAKRDAEKALASSTKSNEAPASLSALRAGASLERAKKYLNPDEVRARLRAKTGNRARKEIAGIKKEKKMLAGYSSPYGEQVGPEVDVEKRESEYKSLQDKRKKFREEKPYKKTSALDKFKGAIKKVWGKAKEGAKKLNNLSKPKQFKPGIKSAIRQFKSGIKNVVKKEKKEKVVAESLSSLLQQTNISEELYMEIMEMVMNKDKAKEAVKREEENALKYADALHHQLEQKGTIDPNLINDANKAADKSFKVSKQVGKRYEDS